jgi:hypothetical protein
MTTDRHTAIDLRLTILMACTTLHAQQRLADAICQWLLSLSDSWQLWAAAAYSHGTARGCTSNLSVRYYSVLIMRWLSKCSSRQANINTIA